jgi:hypothetical protein
MKFKVTIKRSVCHVFFDRLKKLQKKAKKYDIQLNLVSEKEIEKREIIKVGERSVFSGCSWVAQTKEIRTPYKTFEVEVTSEHIQRENVEYVGTVNNEGGIKQIFSKRDDIVLHDEKERCDHCRHNRYRVKYHFFLENGELKSIGSSCAKEYFGINIEVALQVYEIEKNIEEEERCYFSSKIGYSLDDIIAATMYVCKGGAWVKGGVTELLDRVSHPETRKEWKDRKEFEDYIKSHGGGEKINEIVKKVETHFKEKKLRSDFDHNMYNSLMDKEGNIRLWVERGIGVAAYGIFTVIRPEYTRENKKEEKKESEYVGEIGKYIEKEVKVVWTKCFNSNYSYDDNGGLIVKFEDNEGNLLTWFKSDYSEYLDVHGKKVKIRAKVKKHEIYNKEKVTYIYYVKVLDWMKSGK